MVIYGYIYIVFKVHIFAYTYVTLVCNGIIYKKYKRNVTPVIYKQNQDIRVFNETYFYTFDKSPKLDGQFMQNKEF